MHVMAQQANILPHFLISFLLVSILQAITPSSFLANGLSIVPPIASSSIDRNLPTIHHPRTSSSTPRRTRLQMMDWNDPTPFVVTAALATSGGILYFSGAKDREQKRKYAEYEAQVKAMQEEKAKKAYVQPKEFWKEEDLKQYDGSIDPEGPILMAVNGKVFNVYKGRHFYGPGCEYHIFAGRDATRLLAKGKLEEETQEERMKDLNMAERATLQGWMWTFESKYDVVGKLEGFDSQSTSTRTLL